ncbi:MAG TPA: sterol desaturase family protein, partial [Candidatus Elarobacter sp.]|nr:sterol desaturase family protein [Candidatus Elarobacter sp.]
MNSISLGSPVVSGFAAAFIVLLVGDFASTFFYHVPQHVWGKLHLRTHHDRRRSYWDHAVLSRDPAVLLDGFLGAVPYIVLAIACSTISVPGALIGLVLGQLHVWWRHTTELGWRTPAWGVRLARILQIVLPEDHDGHHRNPEIEFGDIFRFYDVPARAFIAYCRIFDPKRRAAMIRRAAIARKREAAAAMKRRKMVKQTS